MKRILGIILTICMLVCILPANVFAATEIKVVHAKVTEPAVGKKPGNVKLTGDTRFEVTETNWSGNLNDDGTFKAGEVYTVEYKIAFKNYKDVIKFRLVIKEGIDVTLNGYKAKITYKDNIEHATLSYTFPVLTESGIADDPNRHLAGVKDSMSSETVVTDTDQTFAEEATRIEERIEFTAVAPVAGQSPVVSAQTTHPDILITSVKWDGVFTPYKKFIAGNEYSLIIDFKIKGDVNKTLQTTSAAKRLAAFNGEWTSYSINGDSGKEGRLNMPLVAKTEKPVVDIKTMFTQQQADERWVTVNPMYPAEIIVTQEQTLDALTMKYNFEQYYCVKKLVIDRSYDNKSQLTADALKLDLFVNIEEIWLGPDVDVKDFMDAYARGRSGLTGDKLMMAIDQTNLDTGKMTMFISDAKFKGYDEIKSIHFLYKRFNTRLYSGDVMEAYKQGASAGYEWCTNHVYDDDIYTPDRVYKMKSCQEPIRFYYSCSKCGKCEYNPNHSVLVNPNFTFHWDRKRSVHWVVERNLSDKYFLGINSRGERVYWKSCVMCGVIYNDDLPPSEGMILPEHALEGAHLQDDAVGAFAVRNDRYVTAKMSEWAQNEVQWASQNGILDLNLLGGDFTKPITRLQFASIAVKLAEVLIGSTISPAPGGTFADTNDEYALKAYASGITSGVSATEFDPNGTLTRQQMATFIYRALMYVRDNTDIRYTTYTPALEQYSDIWSVADWARTSLGFMNALGLVKGVSDTAIDPDGICTIEQAALVANRSVNADEIGWYQVPLSTEKALTVAGGGSCPYYYAPTSHAPTLTRYRNSDRIWVDAPTSGGQKASENADNTVTQEYLITVEPFTGERAYVLKQDFRPIKDLKDTDIAEYNKNYAN